MSLLRNYTVVGSVTLASRLTGFVRDVMIAAVLGSSAIADAYIAAFLLPNLFRRVLSEGAFNAAFVPIYARRIAEDGEKSAQAFAEAALSSLVAVLAIVLLAAELAMPWIISGLAPGFAEQPGKFANAVVFGRIAFVFIAAIVIMALLSSILNARGRYALVAFAPLILNFMLIGVLAVLLVLGWREERRAGMVLVITVLVAGFAQLAFVGQAVAKTGFTLHLGRPRPDRDVRGLMMLILPGLIIAGAGHFNMVVAAQMSSGLPAAVSWLYYADRVFQLPLGFVAAAIGTVLLPEVARALGTGDHDAASAAGNRALEFGLMLVLPAAIALTVLAEPIVDIIYRRGAFSITDSVATAQVLRAIAIGLPGFVLVKVFLPPFLAREAMQVPIAAALAGVAATIVTTLLLQDRYGHVAAPLGVAASAWVNAAVLGIGLGVNGAFHLDAAARRSLPRIVFAALVTGAVAYGMEAGLAGWLTPVQPFTLRAVAIGLICIAGMITHAMAVQVLGVADFSKFRAALEKPKS